MTTHTFDPIEGEARKDDALDRVGDNARPAWITAVVDIALGLPGVWSTDDVWRRLDELDVEQPHEPRAMGSVIRGLAHSGRIAATGTYAKSDRAECHRRPVALWRTVAT